MVNTQLSLAIITRLIKVSLFGNNKKIHKFQSSQNQSRSREVQPTMWSDGIYRKRHLQKNTGEQRKQLLRHSVYNSQLSISYNFAR